MMERMTTADGHARFLLELTQDIGAATLKSVAHLTESGAWQELGFGSPEAMQAAIGEGIRLRYPPEVRRGLALRLADEGLSQRQIAAELGVSPMTVNRALAVPNDTDEGASPARQPANPVPNDTAEPPLPHVAQASGENEWYTPAEYIEAARATMGAIDLDPASTEVANGVVGATRFYTAADDGLSRPWAGNVWLNPPYAQPLIARFCARVVDEYNAGHIRAACVLVNNATETDWFQGLGRTAEAICFPDGRIRYWYPGRPSLTPLQGQAIVYMGGYRGAFLDEFAEFGFIR